MLAQTGFMMDFNQTILDRSAEFANNEFVAGLKMLPSAATIVVGCVDPRVDPADVLGLKMGEVAVVRNVGGRVNASLMETLAILRVVAAAAGRADGIRNLVLLHHTDCGIIGCYRHAPDLLARYLDVDTPSLEALAITDPYKAVEIDVAAIKTKNELPDGLTVSGLVYDVKTGRTEVVVAPAPRRPPETPS